MKDFGLPSWLCLSKLQCSHLWNGDENTSLTGEVWAKCPREASATRLANEWPCWWREETGWFQEHQPLWGPLECPLLVVGGWASSLDTGLTALGRSCTYRLKPGQAGGRSMWRNACSASQRGPRGPFGSPPGCQRRHWQPHPWCSSCSTCRRETVGVWKGLCHWPSHWAQF